MGAEYELFDWGFSIHEINTNKLLLFTEKCIVDFFVAFNTTGSGIVGYLSSEREGSFLPIIENLNRKP